LNQLLLYERKACCALIAAVRASRVDMACCSIDAAVAAGYKGFATKTAFSGCFHTALSFTGISPILYS